MNRRVQMTRSRPWRADHPDAVIVARPTRWGNPFRPERVDGEWMVVADNGVDHSPVANTQAAATALAVDLYRRDIEWLLAPVTVDAIREELAGRDLACWCPISSVCHADVLLEYAGGVA